jgi:hypothetical protein
MAIDDALQSNNHVLDTFEMSEDFDGPKIDTESLWPAPLVVRKRIVKVSNESPNAPTPSLQHASHQFPNTNEWIPASRNKDKGHERLLKTLSKKPVSRGGCRVRICCICRKIHCQGDIQCWEYLPTAEPELSATDAPKSRKLYDRVLDNCNYKQRRADRIDPDMPTSRRENLTRLKKRNGAPSRIVEQNQRNGSQIANSCLPFYMISEESRSSGTPEFVSQSGLCVSENKRMPASVEERYHPPNGSNPNQTLESTKFAQPLRLWDMISNERSRLRILDSAIDSDGVSLDVESAPLTKSNYKQSKFIEYEDDFQPYKYLETSQPIEKSSVGLILRLWSGERLIQPNRSKVTGNEEISLKSRKTFEKQLRTKQSPFVGEDRNKRPPGSHEVQDVPDDVEVKPSDLTANVRKQLALEVNTRNFLRAVGDVKEGRNVVVVTSQSKRPGYHSPDPGVSLANDRHDLRGSGTKNGSKQEITVTLVKNTTNKITDFGRQLKALPSIDGLIPEKVGIWLGAVEERFFSTLPANLQNFGTAYIETQRSAPHAKALKSVAAHLELSATSGNPTEAYPRPPPSPSSNADNFVAIPYEHSYYGPLPQTAKAATNRGRLRTDIIGLPPQAGARKVEQVSEGQNKEEARKIDENKRVQSNTGTTAYSTQQGPSRKVYAEEECSEQEWKRDQRVKQARLEMTHQNPKSKERVTEIGRAVMRQWYYDERQASEACHGTDENRRHPSQMHLLGNAEFPPDYFMNGDVGEYRQRHFELALRSLEGKIEWYNNAQDPQAYDEWQIACAELAREYDCVRTSFFALAFPNKPTGSERA